MIDWLAPNILLRPRFTWWFPLSLFISLFHILNSTLTWEHKVKSSLCVSPCHNHDLTPSTASTQDQLSPVPSQSLISHLSVDHIVLYSLHFHNIKVCKQLSLSSSHASQLIDSRSTTCRSITSRSTTSRSTASWSTVSWSTASWSTASRSTAYRSTASIATTSRWTLSRLTVCRLTTSKSMTSTFLCNVPRLWLLSIYQNVVQSWPPSSHNYSLQVYL